MPDTIVALINRRDQFHRACAEALKNLRLPMLTVWPAVVEAYYLIDRDGGPADIVLHWIQARHLQIMPLGRPEILRMSYLVKKYADLPMGLADAALVAACERAKVHRIFTTDRRDFLVYRPLHTPQFEILP